jgi:hypothetical protein
VTVLSIIIVSFNARLDLERCLESLRAAPPATPHEIIVVDNASTDGSVAGAAPFAPAVRVLRNTVNVGFGRGVNQGLAASTAPLVLIMNPDCRLEPGATAAMEAVLDVHERCALVGPRILNPDGSIQGSARGDPDMLTGLFGRTTVLRRLVPFLPVARRNVVVDEAIGSGLASVEVDWLSGACMLARRTALEAVGGFDERFFLYWEDADLCRRLRARGYHVRYVPGAVAVHQVGQSSGTARTASIRAFHRSAYLYYATHVAPSPHSPKRVLARALLAARCWLQLAASAFR